MEILILFSGTGGGTIGIKRVFPTANYTTIDIEEKYNPTMVKDVLKLTPFYLSHFDLVIASPPCQAYSPSSLASGKKYPKLLDKTIKLCQDSGVSYIVENVCGAKSEIRKQDIILRGWFFENCRDLRRPRKFWCSFPVEKPKRFEKIVPYFRLISGGGGWIKEPEKVKRMSIEEVLRRYPELPKGLTMKDYAQIILPEYIEYLGNQFKKEIDEK